MIVRCLVTVTLPEPTEVVRPSAFSRSALPVMLRSAPVPVVSVTNAGRDGGVGARRVGERRGAGGVDGLLDAAGEVDGVRQIPTVAVGAAGCADIDGGVAVAVGDDIAADAGAGRNRRRRRSRARLEGDGLAVDGQGRRHPPARRWPQWSVALGVPARVRPKAKLAAVPAPSAARAPTSGAEVPPSVRPRLPAWCRRPRRVTARC